MPAVAAYYGAGWRGLSVSQTMASCRAGGCWQHAHGPVHSLHERSGASRASCPPPCLAAPHGVW